MTEQLNNSGLAAVSQQPDINSSAVKPTNIKIIGIELRPLELRSGRWVLHEWQIDQLWPESQDPDNRPAQSNGDNLIFWLPLELFRDERSAYRFNLNSVVPHLFVLCDDSESDIWQPVHISACQDLAASWLDGEQRVLEYPMPEAIQCWIEAFITEHGELIEGKRKKRYAGEDKASIYTGNTGGPQ